MTAMVFGTTKSNRRLIEDSIESARDRVRSVLDEVADVLDRFAEGESDGAKVYRLNAVRREDPELLENDIVWVGVGEVRVYLKLKTRVVPPIEQPGDADRHLADARTLLRRLREAADRDRARAEVLARQFDESACLLEQGVALLEQRQAEVAS